MTLYTPPTPAEVRALLQRWDLSGARAAALLCMGSRSPGRQVRRWAGGESVMSFASLYTLAAHCEVDTWRQHLEPSRWREQLGLPQDVAEKAP